MYLHVERFTCRDYIAVIDQFIVVVIVLVIEQFSWIVCCCYWALTWIECCCSNSRHAEWSRMAALAPEACQQSCPNQGTFQAKPCGEKQYQFKLQYSIIPIYDSM